MQELNTGMPSQGNGKATNKVGEGMSDKGQAGEDRRVRHDPETMRSQSAVRAWGIAGTILPLYLL